MTDLPSTSENPVRVSVSEAARLFGVNPRTIRRAIQEQKVRYIVVQNRYKLSFSSLVQWSQSTGHLRSQRDKDGIGQWVDTWKIRSVRYSPRPPIKDEPKS